MLDMLDCLERDFSRSEGWALSTDVEVSSHLHKGSKVQNLPACSASETFIFSIATKGICVSRVHRSANTVLLFKSYT